ncbi:MAG: hypothetical protein MIO90_01575 [Methanomassiliicoccales archaeon]|nr:hypothetical protein [Methanomassiliicoccales archaeon]
MHTGQIAQAILRSDGEVLRPHLEVRIRERVLIMPEVDMEEHSSFHSMFGEWRGATVLCACGALVRLDQGSVYRRRTMGKPVECRTCRNQRVAMELENLDNEFYDCEGE